MKLDRWVAQQFVNPTGLGGRVVSTVMNRQNRPLYAATLALFGHTKTAAVLDLGCGNGFVMRLAVRSVAGQVIGIDPSPDAIAAARRVNRRHLAAGRMAFKIGQASATGLAAGSIDLAYSINTVYFWDDLTAGYREVARVLRPGGRFLNALYTPATLARFAHTAYGYRTYEPEELLQAAARAGLAAQAVPLLAGSAVGIASLKPSANMAG